MDAAPAPDRADARRDRIVDAALAVALAALVVAGLVTPDPVVAYDFRAANGAAVVLAVLVALPLAVRRRWPVPALATTTAALFLLAAGGWNTGDGAFCLFIGLYTVAAWCRIRAALSGLLLAYAAMAGLALLRAPFFDSPLALVTAGAATVAWALGRGMRHRRYARHRAVARAARAEAARAVVEERAVLDERLRIARDLHDVVSHTLSVIAVQSAVARYQVGGSGPVGGALAAVEVASRAALDDMRRMLGVLRADRPRPVVPGDDGEADPPPRPRVREGVVDLAVAVTLAGLAVAGAFVDDPSDPRATPAPTVGLVVLLLAAGLPLAVRRRWPVAVLVVTSGAAIAVTLLGARYDIAAFCTLVALYTVAAHRPLPVAVAGLALGAAREGALAVVDPPGYEFGTDLAGLGALIPWVLGLIVRRWREERERALRQAFETDRTRAVAAERAAFAERLRIAGELHDVIAHTLTAIAVQSAVARHRLGERPGAAHPGGPALVAIEEASRSALGDLRRMLGTLHADGATDGAGGVHPAPGLAELDLLASAHRAAHGPVELAVDPAVGDTPDSLRLTAYRLVQEALTNVRKHAPGAAARVRVTAAGETVVVQVDDDGPGGAPAATTGYGLAGMRERVALYGGTLHAGPADGGGFRVRAVLRAPQREAAA